MAARGHPARGHQLEVMLVPLYPKGHSRASTCLLHPWEWETPTAQAMAAPPFCRHSSMATEQCWQRWHCHQPEQVSQGAHR